MKKKCGKCQKILSISEFNWKVKNVKKANYCKKCSRKYIRDHYNRNQEYYLKKARKRNKRLRNKAYDYLGEYLQTHLCVDCGETDLLVLEFDHKDRKTKKLEISRILKKRLPLKNLKKEVVKCEVRCANCHRRKTAKESGSWRLKYAPVA